MADAATETSSSSRRISEEDVDTERVLELPLDLPPRRLFFPPPPVALKPVMPSKLAPPPLFAYLAVLFLDFVLFPLINNRDLSPFFSLDGLLLSSLLLNEDEDEDKDDSFSSSVGPISPNKRLA
jgi:hypothetical protein